LLLPGLIRRRFRRRRPRRRRGTDDSSFSTSSARLYREIYRCERVSRWKLVKMPSWLGMCGIEPQEILLQGNSARAGRGNEARKRAGRVGRISGSPLD
jgi:hypothetical protein